MTNALFIWSAIQSFLFGANILLFKRNRANMFLGAFFILTSLNILNQYLSRFTAMKFEVPEILFISDIIGFLYGPVLYLYVRQLTFKDLRLQHFFHFIPALAFAAFFIVREFIIRGPLEFFDYINTPFQQIVLFMIFVSNLVYFIYFLQLGDRYKHHHSHKGLWKIGWISGFYIFFAFKVFTSLVFFTYQGFVQPVCSEEFVSGFRIFSEYVFVSSNAIIILATGYWSIRNPFEVYNLSEQRIQEIQDTTETIPVKERPAKSSSETEPDEGKSKIPDEEAREKIKLLNTLIREKRHLDPDLNERALAEMMDVSTHFLSNLLNEHLGESFTEFINRNRIQEAKQKLLDMKTSNLTIFAIAIDCGYNSESTFYTNFKKCTGLTPINYKKKYQR